MEPKSPSFDFGALLYNDSTTAWPFWGPQASLKEDKSTPWVHLDRDSRSLARECGLSGTPLYIPPEAGSMVLGLGLIWGLGL